jgi:nitroreductase
MEKIATTDCPVADIIARRWSPRGYDPSRPVSRADLMSLLEAARWAPSSANEQPWRYLVFDQSDPEALAKAHDCLAPGNAWAKAAPMLVLSVARLTFARNGRPNRHAAHDVGAASVSMAFQAVNLGLWIHQMGGYDSAKARAYFGIPDDYEPMAVIAVGYMLPEKDIPPEVLQRDSAARTRQPISEMAFRGYWDVTLL